jgi:hypothetical protein
MRTDWVVLSRPVRCPLFTAQRGGDERHAKQRSGGGAASGAVSLLASLGVAFGDGAGRGELWSACGGMAWLAIHPVGQGVVLVAGRCIEAGSVMG